MTPADRAKRIITQEQIHGRYVVSLSDSCWRVLLDMNDSLPRSDQIALIARHIIASEISKALEDEDCHIAALVDDSFLRGKIQYPSQVAQMCRLMAQDHMKRLRS